MKNFNSLYSNIYLVILVSIVKIITIEINLKSYLKKFLSYLKHLNHIKGSKIYFNRLHFRLIAIHFLEQWLLG